MNSLFCLLVLFSLTGCRRPAELNATTDTHAVAATPGEVVLSAAIQRQEQIDVVPVQQGEALNTRAAQGIIALPDNGIWHVGVLAEGRVVQVHANLGDAVSKGQVLARFHTHEVHEVRASYGNAAAELTRRKADETRAQRELDRSERLYQLKAASVADTESARQALADAKAATRIAENNLAAERAHLEDLLDVHSPEALNDMSEEGELIPIKAPASGRILQKNITPGQTVSSSSDTFVIGNLSHLWMLASVNAATRSQLHVGQSAVVSIANVPGATYRGTITNLGMEFNPTTRLAQVRVDIAQPDQRLRPEMLAQAEFSVGETAPSILVPQEALQQVNGQDVVFVELSPERFRLQSVETAELAGASVRITHGLRSGDRVIARGSFVAKGQLLKASIGD